MLKAVFVVACLAACTLAMTAEEQMCVGENANSPNCAKVQCAQHIHCDTCTKDIRCGWCASQGTCFPGLAAGPAKGMNCSTWDFAFCSNLPCASHTSCDSCAADPICGWCSTSNVCTEGSPRGPVFMACIKRDWLHGASMCPVKPANCPCPLPNGDCPAKSECDRNNHIGHHISTTDDQDPESLDDVKWYAAVEDQIGEDVIPPPLMVVEPEPPVEPKVPAAVPQPNELVDYRAAEVQDGFMPSSAKEAIDAQNDN